MRRKLLPILQCIDDARAVHVSRDAARQYAEAKSNGEAEELIASSLYCHLLSPKSLILSLASASPSSPSSARTSYSSSPSHPPCQSQCLRVGAGWGIRWRTARACPAALREGGWDCTTTRVRRRLGGGVTLSLTNHPSRLRWSHYKAVTHPLFQFPPENQHGKACPFIAL
jgi:hypothetical protein